MNIQQNTWGLTLGIAPVPPHLCAKQKEEEEVKTRGVPMDSTSKNEMIKEITRLLKKGIVNHVEIHERLERHGLLPKIRGQEIAYSTLRTYIYKTQRELGIYGIPAYEKVVAMFDQGKTIKQINARVKAGPKYIKDCLMFSGRMKRDVRKNFKYGACKVNFQIANELYSKLKELSAQKSVSMSYLINQSIAAHVDQLVAKQ